MNELQMIVTIVSVVSGYLAAGIIFTGIIVRYKRVTDHPDNEWIIITVLFWPIIFVIGFGFGSVYLATKAIAQCLSFVSGRKIEFFKEAGHE